jgi:hypothetical protein
LLFLRLITKLWTKREALLQICRQILANSTAGGGLSRDQFGRLLVLSPKKEVRFTRVTFNSKGPPTVDRLRWIRSLAWEKQEADWLSRYRYQGSLVTTKLPASSSICLSLPPSLRTLLLSCRRRPHPGQHDSHRVLITHPPGRSLIKESGRSSSRYRYL